MPGPGSSDPATARVPTVDLNLLRTFIAVYRASSFTAAAHGLGLSQPTVTAQIRALEQHTGRQLFTRLARGVEPTAFGHELAGRVTTPLDTLAAIDDSEALGGSAAPVRLAGPAALLGARVLPALAE
jgi:DNA-binding transcriptional LysR family regulator